MPNCLPLNRTRWRAASGRAIAMQGDVRKMSLQIIIAQRHANFARYPRYNYEHRTNMNTYFFTGIFADLSTCMQSFVCAFCRNAAVEPFSWLDEYARFISSSVQCCLKCESCQYKLVYA